MPGIIRTALYSTVISLACITLNGCSLGPKALRSDRPAYNIAIQHSEKEELLLNLVRTRFGESIKFLQVSSIVSTMNYAAGLNGNMTLPFGAPLEIRGPNVGNVGGNLNYAEVPTVTYVPLEGAQFATQMLTHASVNTLNLLLQSGWNFALISSIMVDRLGNLPNTPGLPGYTKFQQLVELLNTIQTRGDLTLGQVYLGPALVGGELPAEALDFRPLQAEGATWGYKPIGGGKFQILKILGPTTVLELKYANEAEAESFTALTGTQSSRQPGQLTERIRLIDALNIPFQPDTYPEPATELNVHLRSFVDQLVYLAQGVDVQESEKRAAMPTGNQKLDFIHIHQSDSRPGNAYIAVPYRGHWFYIADEDLESKGTMALLLMTLSLQTTGGGAAPALTLPLGGGGAG